METKLTMGEKLKDLRTERGLTTKDVSRLTGISEAVYNGLENDADRDTGYSRIISLAKFYDVPTDYLLGFTESRITKNIELKELHLTDKAIEILLSGKQNNYLLSDIIEHDEFSNLINSIDVYVRQLAAPHINTVNNMLKIAQHGIENYYSDNKPNVGNFYDIDVVEITEIILGIFTEDKKSVFDMNLEKYGINEFLKLLKYVTDSSYHTAVEGLKISLANGDIDVSFT